VIDDQTPPYTGIYRTQTLADYRARLESYVRVYLEARASGLTPPVAARNTITRAFPKWHDTRATHVTSVFIMFTERYRRTMRRERDLVFLMLACICMTEGIAPPTHFVRGLLSKMIIQLLNEHWTQLDRPAFDDAHATDRLISRLPPPIRHRLAAMIAAMTAIAPRIRAAFTRLTGPRP
jgi:hypothetical protein